MLFNVGLVADASAPQPVKLAAVDLARNSRSVVIPCCMPQVSGCWLLLLLVVVVVVVVVVSGGVPVMIVGCGALLRPSLFLQASHPKHLQTPPTPHHRASLS